MFRGRRLFASTVVVVGALAVLGACGEDREDTGTTATGTGTAGSATAPAGEPVATVQLRESEFEIEPRKVRVDRSGVVAFQASNTGEIEHALEVEGSEGESETEEFGPGETVTLEVLLQPGEYKMYCPVGDHEERGMTGTVVVAGDSEGG